MWQAIRPWLFPVSCIGCGRPGVGLCAACTAGTEPTQFELDGVPIYAASAYEGPVRDAILALKRGERAYLDPLAHLIAPLVAPGVTLVPLNTSRGRAAERGFDQARELARRAASAAGANAVDVLVKRGGPQRGLDRDARLRAKGRFAVHRGRELPATAVLIDDVVTTGATLRDAIDLLAAGGCRVTEAVVVARTLPGRETSARRG